MVSAGEFLNHVKDVLANYETVSFDESKLPRDLGTEDGKVFLSMIYKAIKPPEPEGRKVVAIKVLTTVTTKTKKSAIINPLLGSKLWKLFCEQHRLYIRNNLEPVDPAYGDEYYMLLDHMLERFKMEMGLDNDNVETPFSKYWRAVKMKEADKSKVFSNLVVLATNLQADKPETISKFKAELASYQDNPQYTHRIRSLCDAYKKRSLNMPFFQKTEGISPADCFQAKKEFFYQCEKEFYFGDANDKDYDLLREIVGLEEKKSSLIGGSRMPREARENPEVRNSVVPTPESRPPPSLVPENRRENAPVIAPPVATSVVSMPIPPAERVSRPQSPMNLPSNPGRMMPSINPMSIAGPVPSPIHSVPQQPNDSLDQIRNSFQPLLTPQINSVTVPLRPPTPNNEIRSQLSSQPIKTNPPAIPNVFQESALPKYPPPYDPNFPKGLPDHLNVASNAAPANLPPPIPNNRFAIFADFPPTKQSKTPLVRDPILEELEESKRERGDFPRTPPEASVRTPGLQDNLAPIVQRSKLPDWSREEQFPIGRHVTFKHPSLTDPTPPQPAAAQNTSLLQPQQPTIPPVPFQTSPFRTIKLELKPARVEQVSEMKFQDIGRLKSLCYLKKGKVFENEDYKVGVSCYKQVDSVGQKQLLVQCSYEPLPARSVKMALFQLSHNDFKISAHPDEAYVELPVKEAFLNGRYPLLQIDQRNSSHRIVSKEIPVLIPVIKTMFVRPESSQLTNPDAPNFLKRLETDWSMLDHNFFKGIPELLVAFKGLVSKPTDPDTIAGDFEVLGLKYLMSLELTLNAQGEFRMFLYYNKMESETKAKAFLTELVLLLVDPTTL